MILNDVEDDVGPDSYEEARLDAHQRRAAGLCVACGLRLSDDDRAGGFVACARCRPMRAAKARRYRGAA